jgi:hypothetical protein
MQHVTMAEKSLLVGDEVAALLLEYAALVAQVGTGSTVQVNAIGGDGDPVVASFLFNSGTVLMVESTHSELPEPENAEAEADLRARLDAYSFNDSSLIGLGQSDGPESSS